MSVKKFDETMQSTIDFAKNVLPEKSSLDLQCLFAVLLQQPEFNGRYPVLENLFPDPPKLDSKAESLKPDKVVRGVFKESKLDGLISSELVFKNVLFHDGLFDGLEAGLDNLALPVLLLALAVFGVHENPAGDGSLGATRGRIRSR